MFKLGLTKSIALALIYQPLLNGVLLHAPKQILRSIVAVRIPGGLTPP